MTDTPESRRDSALADIIAAGGVITADPIPLAHPSDPTVIVAYELRVSAPDLDVVKALSELKKETATDLSGLVYWIPAPDNEPEN